MYGETARYYDTIFPFNPAVSSFLERQIVKSTARVLDVGCGTGKYTAALARSHDVTGIDPDAASIALARREYPDVKFAACDLFGFAASGPFDLVFCIGNVIAHIPPDALKQFVERVHQLLGPGGIWVFHTVNWDEILKKDVHVFPVIERSGLSFTRFYREITPDRVFFDTALSVPAGVTYPHRVPLYPLRRARVGALHQRFQSIAIYADYLESPDTEEATSRVYVFQKRDAPDSDRGSE